MHLGMKMTCKTEWRSYSYSNFQELEKIDSVDKALENCDTWKIGSHEVYERKRAFLRANIVDHCASTAARVSVKYLFFYMKTVQTFEEPGTVNVTVARKCMKLLASSRFGVDIV
jgi:hypothetical protein